MFKYLFLIAGISFLSHFASADGCAMGSIPWSNSAKGVGYSYCKQYNFNQTRCLTTPDKKDAIGMSLQGLQDELLKCKAVCDYSKGTFQASAPSQPQCDYVEGLMGSLDSYYHCVQTAEVSCK